MTISDSLTGLQKIDHDQTDPREWSVDDLLAKAEDLIDAFQFEAAEKFVSRVLETSPDHPTALQFAASIMIETGRLADAQTALRRAISLQPDTGYEKYFCLAQLSEGRDALRCYERGVSILTSSLARPSHDEPEEDIRLKASSGLCAAAELYMTDLCEEEDAELQCTQLLQQAHAADPSNPEYFRVLADLRLVQQRPEEARQALESCYGLWRHLRSHDTACEEDQDEQSAEPARGLPNYDFRLSCAKIMIEVGMFPEAEEVVDGLLADDDEAALAWYLLGVLTVVSEGDQSLARETFLAAEALILREDEEVQDGELLESVQEFLGDLPDNGSTAVH